MFIVKESVKSSKKIQYDCGHCQTLHFIFRHEILLSQTKSRLGKIEMNKPTTLAELKESGYESRSVKDEMRANLIKKLRTGERLFPGIVGYEETVIPQIVNSVLARHN